MLQQLNYILVTASLCASTIAILTTFSFIQHIYTSHQSQRKMLLPIFSAVVGTGIWINHIILGIALHHDLTMLFNLGNATIAWGFTLIIGFIIINNTSKRNNKMSSFIRDSAIASLCTLGLFYFLRPTSSTLMYDYFTTPMTLFFGAFVIFVMMTVLSWTKVFASKHKAFIKILSAFSLSLGIASIHFAFNSAFISNAIISYTGHINEQLMGIIIALVFVSFFLLMFIANMLFEKHGKNIFKLRFLDPSQDATFNIENMKDSLTNLPNRKAFDFHIESAVKRSARTGNTFALAYIDLDYFKPVNDYHGHHVGDKVLINVAERLNMAVRGCDYIARIGGDEFVAIIEDITSHDDITPIASRIVNSIKNTFIINRLNIEISCSVGIAMYTKDGDTQKLIANADAAMYKAKEEGKNQFKFYDAQIESASDLMIQLQSDLCLAIERKEFRLDFLPKIDVKTMTIVGAEALIRWIHPIKGELLPNKFLPAAERLGLITEISDWVLDECCSTIAYAKQHNIDLDLSINLPVQQFLKESLVKNILKTIIYYDLNTKNLSFEIKESLAVNNQTQFKAVLDHFKEAGINVVLDDFGLQTFSLSHLQSLNIDGIKIDRSFIRNVNKNKASKSIIEALVKIAHALNFSVVAEGVENIDQRDTLVFLGCDYLQGHLFSKPLGIDALLAFYKDIETKQLELKLETDKTSPQEIPGHLTESA